MISKQAVEKEDGIPIFHFHLFVLYLTSKYLITFKMSCQQSQCSTMIKPDILKM